MLCLLTTISFLVARETMDTDHPVIKVLKEEVKNIIQDEAKVGPSEKEENLKENPPQNQDTCAPVREETITEAPRQDSEDTPTSNSHSKATPSPKPESKHVANPIVNNQNKTVSIPSANDEVSDKFNTLYSNEKCDLIKAKVSTRWIAFKIKKDRVASTGEIKVLNNNKISTIPLDPTIIEESQLCKLTVIKKLCDKTTPITREELDEAIETAISKNLAPSETVGKIRSFVTNDVNTGKELKTHIVEKIESFSDFFIPLGLISKDSTPIDLQGSKIFFTLNTKAKNGSGMVKTAPFIFNINKDGLVDINTEHSIHVYSEASSREENSETLLYIGIVAVAVLLIFAILLVVYRKMHA